MPIPPANAVVSDEGEELRRGGSKHFIFYRWKWRGPKLMTIELNRIENEDITSWEHFAGITVGDILKANLLEDTEFEPSGTGTFEGGRRPATFKYAALVDID